MRTLFGAAAVLMLAGFVTGQEKKDDKKDEKIDGKKLIGKWEPVELPKGVSLTVEFAEKEKVSINVDFMEKKEKIEGTYKLDGNKLSLTIAFGGKEDTKTTTITKLTDEEFATKDAGGKEEKFKRVKAK